MTRTIGFISGMTQREVDAHDTLVRLARRLGRLKPASLDKVFERWQMLHMLEGAEQQQVRAWLKRVTDEVRP